MQKYLLAGVCTLAFSFNVSAEEAAHCHQPTSAEKAPAAPIGIMGDHLHPKGEWMVSYRYDRTGQTGLRDGTDRLSIHDALDNYLDAPVEMQMDMHMVEGMVGLTDKLSLMAMGGWMQMDMVHEAHHSHHRHAMNKEGLMDTQVTALYGVAPKVNLHAGLSLPTGSIDEDFINHHNKLYRLPYNMQFGSGTVDPILGVTYADHAGSWGWGAQALGTFRLYDNTNDYRFGNRYTANLWGAKQLDSQWDASLRLEGNHWQEITGADRGIPATSMVGANPNGTGGTLVNALLGVGYSPSLKALEGQRLAVEFGAPVYQHYTGPILETDYRLTAGWKWKL
jgi:hypothetical protein